METNNIKMKDSKNIMYLPSELLEAEFQDLYLQEHVCCKPVLSLIFT